MYQFLLAAADTARGVTRCAVKGGRGFKISPVINVFIYSGLRGIFFHRGQSHIFRFFPGVKCFFPVEISKLVHTPTQKISDLSNKQKKKKKKKKKNPLLIHYLSPSSILSFHPLLLQFPQTFQRWATHPPRPPLVTPLGTGSYEFYLKVTGIISDRQLQTSLFFHTPEFFAYSERTSL